jgi:hypothetical protein
MAEYQPCIILKENRKSGKIRYICLIKKNSEAQGT